MDQSKVEGFQERIFTELNGGMSCLNLYLGHQLGLLQKLADADSVTPVELAQQTGYVERYLREWLECMAAGEYLDYEPASGRFSLPAEHAAVLTEPENPASAMGAFGWLPSLTNILPQLMEAFRKGGGDSS